MKLAPGSRFTVHYSFSVWLIINWCVAWMLFTVLPWWWVFTVDHDDGWPWWRGRIRAQTHAHEPMLSSCSCSWALMLTFMSAYIHECSVLLTHAHAHANDCSCSWALMLISTHAHTHAHAHECSCSFMSAHAHTHERSCSRALAMLMSTYSLWALMLMSAHACSW